KNEKIFLVFLSGIFACLAFLSKQYGLIYMVFCGIYAGGALICKPASTLKKLLATWFLIGAGTLFPVLILLLVYAFLEVSPADFFSDLIVKAYAEESLSNYFSSTGNFLLKNGLVFLLIPILFFTKYENSIPRKHRFILFLILLVLLTSVYY